MEHILNIAFDFDDDKVRQTAENAANKEMDKIVKNIVLDKIAPMSSGYYGRQERDWSRLWKEVEDAIAKILSDSSDEIIEKAADKLVKSVRSSKSWKEKVAEIEEAVAKEFA